MSKKNRIYIPEDQKTKCNAIIHSAAVAAGGVGTGMAQIPIADNAVITPIQIGMIVALGKVFDQEITDSAAKAIIGGAAAAFAGRGLSQLLVGWIPGVGNAVNAATAAAITEAIGWMAVDNFAKDQKAGMVSNINDETSKSCTVSVYEESCGTNVDGSEQTIAENLMSRASEFLNKKKDRKNNKEEYNQLLNDFEKALLRVSKDDPLNALYDKLTDI